MEIWNAEVDSNDIETLLVSIYKLTPYMNYPFSKKDCRNLKKSLKKTIKRVRKIDFDMRL